MSEEISKGVSEGGRCLSGLYLVSMARVVALEFAPGRSHLDPNHRIILLGPSCSAARADRPLFYRHSGCGIDWGEGSGMGDGT